MFIKDKIFPPTDICEQESQKEGFEVLVEVDSNNPPHFISPKIDLDIVTQYIKSQVLPDGTYSSIKVLLKSSNSDTLRQYFQTLQKYIQYEEITQVEALVLFNILSFINSFRGIPLGNASFKDAQNPEIDLYLDNIVFMKFVAQKLLPNEIFDDRISEVINDDIFNIITTVFVHEVDHVKNQDGLNSDSLLYLLISLLRSGELIKYLSSDYILRQRIKYQHSSHEKRAWSNHHFDQPDNLFSLAESDWEQIEKLETFVKKVIDLDVISIDLN